MCVCVFTTNVANEIKFPRGKWDEQSLSWKYEFLEELNIPIWILFRVVFNSNNIAADGYVVHIPLPFNPRGRRLYCGLYNDETSAWGNYKILFCRHFHLHTCVTNLLVYGFVSWWNATRITHLFHPIQLLWFTLVSGIIRGIVQLPSFWNIDLG